MGLDVCKVIVFFSFCAISISETAYALPKNPCFFDNQTQLEAAFLKKPNFVNLLGFEVQKDKRQVNVRVEVKISEYITKEPYIRQGSYGPLSQPGYREAKGQVYDYENYSFRLCNRGEKEGVNFLNSVDPKFADTPQTALAPSFIRVFNKKTREQEEYVSQKEDNSLSSTLALKGRRHAPAAQFSDFLSGGRFSDFCFNGNSMAARLLASDIDSRGYEKKSITVGSKDRVLITATDLKTKAEKKIEIPPCGDSNKKDGKSNDFRPEPKQSAPPAA